MTEIDGMDMLGYLKLRAWDANHKKEKNKPKATTIDAVWAGLAPGIS